MEIHSGISTVRIAPGGLLNHVRCNSLHVGIFDVLEGDKVADVRDRIAKAAQFQRDLFSQWEKPSSWVRRAFCCRERAASTTTSLLLLLLYGSSVASQ